MGVSLAAVVLTAFMIPLLWRLLLLLPSTMMPLSPRDDGRRPHPSPPGLPILGHLHLLGSLPHRSFRSLATSYGPVMLLKLGRVPTVVVSSAAAAEEAMKTRDLAFAGRPRMLMAERLLYGCDVALAPYGNYWRQARRICVLHLLSPRRILSFRPVREQIVATLIGRIRAATAAHPKGLVNLSEALIWYTNTVISWAAFGAGDYGLQGDDDGGEGLRRVFADFMELIPTPTMREIAPWLGWVDTLTGLEAKTKRTFEVLDSLLERVIEEHRRQRQGGRRVEDGQNDHHDFVDVLLDVAEMDKQDGFQLGMNNMKAIILDMFVGGTDTSYMVLEWAMAELMNHPHQLHKLQGEIRASVGGADHVSEDHLGAMPYLKAVISETLRLQTPGPLLVPRETTEDTELLGYHIPARTRVVINAWAIGRDLSTWDRAEEFVPERFIDTPVDYSKVGQDFRFLPFGAGRRGRPGAAFAAPTTELALANLLFHFDWEILADGRMGVGASSSSLDMTEVYGLSVRLKTPLLLVAKPYYGQ
ncbi:hypothetical protein ACP70R_012086 [Stipagrostis hirtigluma subsp. patula]